MHLSSEIEPVPIDNHATILFGIRKPSFCLLLLFFISFFVDVLSQLAEHIGMAP
jgi:hypothetical protein